MTYQDPGTPLEIPPTTPAPPEILPPEPEPPVTEPLEETPPGSPPFIPPQAEALSLGRYGGSAARSWTGPVTGTLAAPRHFCSVGIVQGSIADG